MTVFPTAGHLASWAGRWLSNNITGGKRRSGRPQGQPLAGRRADRVRLGRCQKPTATLTWPLSSGGWLGASARRRPRSPWPLHPGDLLVPAGWRLRLPRPMLGDCSSAVTATVPASAPSPSSRPSATRSPSTRRLTPGDSRFRESSAPGARPHAGWCWAAVQWRRRSGPPRGCRHRGAVLGGRTPPGAVTRAKVGPPSGCRGSRGCRTPASRSLPCPPRPAPRGTSVQPVERTARRPGAGGLSVRTHGVRASSAGRTLWCPEARPPRCPRAGPGVARCGGPPLLGAAGRRAPWSVGGVGACPHGAGRKGMVRRWPWLAHMRVDRSPGPRLAGVPAGAPWPPADTGAGPGPGAGRVAGEHGTAQVLTGPAGRPGQVVGVVPDYGPGPRGGDHAGWSLGWWWSVASSSGGPTRFGGGAACGRAAAAGHTERCPLGADRSFTSENSGGRDGV